MKGVPVRLEVGPRDIENGVVVAVRRDTLEKLTLPMEGLAERLVKLMEEIHQGMYNAALEHRKTHTTTAENFGEFIVQVVRNLMRQV